jgi:outer membrane lipoprotein SlyB
MKEVVMEMDNVVFGLYESRADLERAVKMLEADGFDSSEISVLLPNTDEFQEFDRVKKTKIQSDARTGAEAGALVGGALGMLIGIGTFAIPGLGALVFLGPIFSGLVGVGLGGAFGGLSGALVGMGVPKQHATVYEGKLADGNTLIAVHAEDELSTVRAQRALEKQDGKHIAVIACQGTPWKTAPFEPNYSLPNIEDRF